MILCENLYNFVSNSTLLEKIDTSPWPKMAAQKVPKRGSSWDPRLFYISIAGVLPITYGVLQDLGVLPVASGVLLDLIHSHMVLVKF